MDDLQKTTANQKNLIILHLTVFVWGFTGILGALISINAVQMVWYRVLIAQHKFVRLFFMEQNRHQGI